MSISALNRINTVISISKAAAHYMNSTKNKYSVTIYFYFLKRRRSAECSYCSKPNNRIIKDARKLLSCVPPKNKSHEGEKTMTESLFVTKHPLKTPSISRLSATDVTVTRELFILRRVPLYCELFMRPD